MGLSIAEISMDIEEKYGFKFPESGWENIKTVEDYIGLVSKLDGSVKDIRLYQDEVLMIIYRTTHRNVVLNDLLKDLD